MASSISMEPPPTNGYLSVTKPPPTRQDMNADGTETILYDTAKLFYCLACPPLICCPALVCTLCLDPPNKHVTEAEVQQVVAADQRYAAEHCEAGVTRGNHLTIAGSDFAFSSAEPDSGLPAGLTQQQYEQILYAVYEAVQMRSRIGQQRMTRFTDVSEERLLARRTVQKHAMQQLQQQYAVQGVDVNMDWCPMEEYYAKYHFMQKYQKERAYEPCTLHITVREDRQAMPPAMNSQAGVPSPPPCAG